MAVDENCFGCGVKGASKVIVAADVRLTNSSPAATFFNPLLLEDFHIALQLMLLVLVVDTYVVSVVAGTPTAFDS